MEIKVIYKNARAAVVEIADGGIFNTNKKYELILNGEHFGETDRVITNLNGLKPDTQYELQIQSADGDHSVIYFATKKEFVTLNVKDFGAKGDGEQDDTHFIQAAIMACPKDGRVLIPAGTYRVTAIFLKDDLNLELAEGATILAITDRTKFAILPGMIQAWDEQGEYNLGTWEGNPLAMYAGILVGINVKNATVYGKGVVDGNASWDNWWKNAKTMGQPFRPRMIFLNHCENVVIQGITVQNSPSWNIHPYFSDHLRFLGIQVLNPKVSPNTDGLDPESCKDVEITGVYFSVGDDCIAVKAGKIYMGAKYRRPCEDVVIRQCCMRDGHGSVTIGSEMAGGVKNLTVKDCRFLHTDRGLRIKTRRGRGEAAVVEGILFENICMDNVMTPFVANSFYFCDPDGHTEYVRTQEALPVDERTPWVKSLAFRNIDAKDCHVAAAWLYGLPEQPIERVELENVHVTYAKNPQAGQAAMMEDCPKEMNRMGICAANIDKLVLRNVTVEGQDGEELSLLNVKSVERI